MNTISKGVCAAQGFRAAGIHCGIRKNTVRRDLTLILSACKADAAAVYTTNLVKGAPILVTMDHLLNGKAKAIICNSGNANACCENGIEAAETMCALAAKACGISPQDVIVASTGVIGQPLDTSPIERGMPALYEALGSDETANFDAAEGIMTTDTHIKSASVSFTAGSKTCRIGGIAKGSGMIHPDLATMLVFLTTDCAISSEMLSLALKTDVQKTFNMTSVDGDTSTNDMCCILANGLSGNARITAEGPDFDSFMKALNTVTVCLCKQIAADGEGASKFLECRVTGAASEEAAARIARSVISSSLVKTAMFGADANWGRILCAAGYAGVPAGLDRADVAFSSKAGRVLVCENGFCHPFDEGMAKTILTESEIEILLTLKDGTCQATAWGCDLTHDYIRINGDYRT